MGNSGRSERVESRISWTAATWIHSLDPLRGTAALAVVMHHACQAWGIGKDVGTPPEMFIEWLGAWGVALFFVLSGFCIHLPQARAELSGKAGVDWSRFAWRRARRLLPTHYAALILSVVVAGYISTGLLNPATPGSFLAHVFMVHVWYGPYFASINGVFWSIAVEVHFYLCYPIYLYLRRSLGSFSTAFILCTAGLIVYFFASLLPDGSARLVMQRIFLVTWWQWALGAAIADLYVTGQAGEWMWVFTGDWMPAVWIVLSLAVGLQDPHPGGLHVRFWILPVCCAGVLGSLVTRSTRPVWFLSYAGNFSYSIYLVHPIVFGLLFRFTPVRALPAASGIALCFAGALAGSWVFFQSVEKHFLHRSGPFPINDLTGRSAHAFKARGAQGCGT